MKASASTHLFVYDRLAREHFAWIAEAGFGAVELWAAEHHFPHEDDAAVAQIADWLRELNLETASIHLPFYVRFGRNDFRYIGVADPDPEGRRIMRERCERLLDVATKLHCSRFILHPTNTFSRDGSNLRRLRQALDHLVPECEKRGQSILLENIMMPESRANLLAEVCADYGPSVGICLDTGHAHIDGGLLFEIANAGKYLRALHVHDNFGITDEHLVPGEGNIDWPATLSTLRMKAPSRELFTFELAGPAGDQPEHEAQWRQRLAAAFDFWQQHFGDNP